MNESVFLKAKIYIEILLLSYCIAMCGNCIHTQACWMFTDILSLLVNSFYRFAVVQTRTVYWADQRSLMVAEGNDSILHSI